MTILVSSVGDTFVNILQEKTRKQIGDNDSPDSSNRIPITNCEAQLGYTRGSQQPLRELPGNEEDLKQLVQSILPQEITKLSGKLMKLARITYTFP